MGTVNSTLHCTAEHQANLASCFLSGMSNLPAMLTLTSYWHRFRKSTPFLHAIHLLANEDISKVSFDANHNIEFDRIKEETGISFVKFIIDLNIKKTCHWLV